MLPEQFTPNPEIPSPDKQKTPYVRDFPLDKWSPYLENQEGVEYKKNPWGFRATVENKLVEVNGKKIAIQVLSNFEVLMSQPDPEDSSASTSQNPENTPPSEEGSTDNIHIYHTGGMKSLGIHHIGDTVNRWYQSQDKLPGFNIKNLTLLSHPWGSPTDAESLNIEECGQALAQCIPEKTHPNQKTVITGLSSGASVSVSLLAALAKESREVDAFVGLEPVGLTENKHLIRGILTDALGAFRDNLRKHETKYQAFRETYKQLMASMATSEGAPRNLIQLINTLIKADPEVNNILKEYPELNQPVGLDITALGKDSTNELREQGDSKTPIVILSIIRSEVSYVFKELINFVDEHEEVMYQYPTLKEKLAAAAKKVLFPNTEDLSFLSVNSSSHLVIGSDQSIMTQIAEELNAQLNSKTPANQESSSSNP